MKIQSLIFVYNANSGAVNALLDTAHKIVSPDTYECSLCALTFGNFKENITWKAFRESANVEMLFLHKNEFLKQYRSKWLPKYDFPIVLMKVDDQLEAFVTKKELNLVESTESLISLINNRFEEFKAL